MSETLSQFLEEWQKQYKHELDAICLFKTDLTSKWSEAQKKEFAGVMFHQRGHFHDLAWQMGNLAPSEKFKKIILKNLSDEFGGPQRAHERLFCDFASSLGQPNIYLDFVEEKYNVPWVREFNKGHIRYIFNHPWPNAWAAWSGYEYLENVDYLNLLNLSKSLGLTNEKDLIFWEIHISIPHFEEAEEDLLELWNQDKEGVKHGLNWIRDHQVKMWHDLDNHINSVL